MTHVAAPAKRNRRPGTRRSPPSCASIAFGAALLLGPTCAVAEVQVRGTLDAARVEVQGGSIDEVLAALGKAFDLRWRTSSPLDKPLTGTYEGSLNRVLTRVLDGYNFVLKASDGRIEINVLGPRGGTAVAGASAPGAASSAKTAPPTTAKPATPPAGPMLAAAVNETVGPAALAPTLTPATMVAEGPNVGPVPGQGVGTVKPPEPMPSTVEPPMPGQGTGAVPELKPSAVLPPGAAAAPPVPEGAAPPSGAPPAPPKT